jgi:hypothetical protein
LIEIKAVAATGGIYSGVLIFHRLYPRNE